MSFFKQSNNRTIAYMQNSGFLNGNVINSVILSCKGRRDEVEDIIKHASSFIERNHVTNPIFWKNFIEKDPMTYKNMEGEFVANQIRDRCMTIGQMNFQGGHIYGGKTSDKFIQLPSIEFDFLPLKMPNKMPIIMNVCKFDGVHKCEVQLWKGSVEEIKNYQQQISKMIVKREIQKWSNTSHRKKNLILDELSKIQNEVKMNYEYL